MTGIDPLPVRHRKALHWFAANTGATVGWPAPLPDGTLLACRPKGIYKPRWSNYALSIREMLNRPYPDETPIRKDDGTWMYRYFQENLDPNARDQEYTNAGLLAYVRDQVPVGALRQVARRPSRYEVLGAAFVRRWRDGFFELEGPAT